MYKVIRIGLVLTLMIFLGSCDYADDGEKISISEIDSQAIETEDLSEKNKDIEEINGLSSFDKEYINLNTLESYILFNHERIFYTKSIYYQGEQIINLYYYDINLNETVELIKNLAGRDIYLVNNYLYYIKENGLERINVDTFEDERIVTAKPIAEIQQRNVRDGKVFTHHERFTRLLVTDNIVYTAVEYGVKGEEGGGGGYAKAYAKIDEWDFHYWDDYYSYGEEGNSIPKDNPILEIDIEQNMIYCINEDGSKELSTLLDISNAKERLSKDIVYGYTTTDASGIYDTLYKRAMFDTESTDEVFKEIPARGDNDEWFMSIQIRDFGQYILYYLYKEEQDTQEEYHPYEVILIDSKNDKMYTNEEIDEVISGDITYQNLFFTDFYLDDDTLYMIEYAYENLSETSEKKRTYVDLYRAKIVDGKLNFERLFSEIEN